MANAVILKCLLGKRKTPLERLATAKVVDSLG